jgi:hypothetical protein
MKLQGRYANTVQVIDHRKKIVWRSSAVAIGVAR